MKKRSKVTLFGLLALIAAFGLILTGCPDPNSSESTKTVTEWRDKPAIQVANVLFEDGDGSGDFPEITFSVVLPSGEWDSAAESAGSSDLESLFAIGGNTAVGTVFAGAAYSAIIDPSDSKKLNITVTSTVDAVSYISKVSVKLDSLDIGDFLTAETTGLALGLDPAVWNYPDALVSVGEVTFVDGTAAAKASATVELKLSKGTWKNGLSRSEATALFTSIVSTVVTPVTISGYTAGNVTGDGTATAILTLEAGSIGATTFGTVVATLNSAAALTGLIDGGGAAMFDIDKLESTTATVSLASTTSHGTKGYKSITGLTTSAYYLLKDSDGVWYKVAADGTFEEITGGLTSSIGAVAAAGAGKVEGLDNSKTYDVYNYLLLTGTTTITSSIANKNTVVYLNADGGITVAGSSSTACTVIYILDSAIATINTGTSGTTLTLNDKVTTADETWQFTAVSNAGGAIDYFEVTGNTITVSGGDSNTAYTLTRA